MCNFVWLRTSSASIRNAILTEGFISIKVLGLRPDLKADETILLFEMRLTGVKNRSAVGACGYRHSDHYRLIGIKHNNVS